MSLQVPSGLSEKEGPVGLDLAACQREVDRLRDKDCLEDLAVYRQMIESWGDYEQGSVEYQLFAYASNAFYELFLALAAQIKAFIDKDEWASPACRALHQRLTSCDPAYVNLQQNDYAIILDDHELPPGVDDEDDELFAEYIESWLEEHAPDEPEDDGYGSDNSDDEFDNEAFDEDFKPRQQQPPKEGGSVAARRHRKERAKKRDKKKKDSTFRYAGKFEPAPDEIIQRVHAIRKKYGDSDGREDEQIAMAAIRHPRSEWTDEVEAAFQEAKQLFAEGRIADLAKMKIKFCLAQYRGITYKTPSFDSRSRQISRRESELSRAIYSMSVLKAARVDPTDYFQGRCSKEEHERLEERAQHLKQVLLEKRNGGPVNIYGIRFDTAADAIQHIYSNKYDYFHSLAGQYLANQERWREDKEKNLREVWQKARDSKEALGRVRPYADLGRYNTMVRSLQGHTDSEEDWLRYVKTHDFVVDNKTFERQVESGAIQGFTRHDYKKYCGIKAPLPLNEYRTIVKEYQGYGLGHEEYARYSDERSTANERMLDAFADNAQRAYLEERYGFIPPEDWEIFEGFLNGYCPVVSTGDNPRHALKYAYGMKFYQGHYHERLKPRWGDDGLARRPYVGKVYCSLHPLDEYLADAPMHVPSMNLTGRIIVTDLITEERESTFPAYIPAQRTVVEHIAKVPSFPGNDAKQGYRKVHLLKYGLDPEQYAELYAQLHQSLAAEKEAPKPKAKSLPDTKPESPMDAFLQRLCAWLVNYQEVRLVEIARRMAFEKGMFLVYRNSLGQLARGITSVRVYPGLRLPDLPNLDSQNPMELREKRRYVFSSPPKNEDKAIEKERESWNKPRQTLRNRLEGTYEVHATPPDGNCLFHALSGVLFSHAHDELRGHVSLRKHLVQVMGSEGADYAALRHEHAVDNAYLGEMAQVAMMPGQISRWGGDAEIRAFCIRYSARIRVYAPAYPGPDHYTEFDPPLGVVPRFTGHILHVNGNHWEYLVPRN